MLINKHFDCLHSSNYIKTVLREAKLLKIPVTISSSCHLYVHTHALIILLFSFHIIEKRSLLRSGNNGLHYYTGFISCKQFLYIIILKYTSRTACGL